MAYTSLSGFKRSRSNSEPDVSYTRRELLDKIVDTIDTDEARVKLLLQAFDILDIENTPRPEPDDDQITVVTPQKASLLPPSTSNTFLDTPLREKYFTKLSPSVLRELLRSPSPRAYTPDRSFEFQNEEQSHLDTTSISFPSIPSLELPDAKEVTGIAYPLTPPLTARIPSIDSHEFETPVRFSSFHSSLSFTTSTNSTLAASSSSYPSCLQVEAIPDVDSVPDLKACLSSMTPYQNRYASSSGFSRRQQGTLDTPQSVSPSHAQFRAKPPFSFFLNTVSPSAVRQPKCVADEIRAGGETPEERRTFLMSLLRNRSQNSGELAHTTRVTSKAGTDGETIYPALPSTPVSPSLRLFKSSRNTSYADAETRPRNSHTKQPIGSKPVIGRILQREFIELLEARAAEEEKQAKELGMVAERLERLAMQKKKLAQLMMEQTNF